MGRIAINKIATMLSENFGKLPLRRDNQNFACAHEVQISGFMNHPGNILLKISCMGTACFSAKRSAGRISAQNISRQNRTLFLGNWSEFWRR